MDAKGNLQLGRRVNQGILIGPEILVRVVRIEGNTVRLMIQAPKSINIVREELSHEPRKNNL